MDPRERRQVAIICRLISRMLEGNGNGTHDNGQNLARSRQRDSQRDTGTDILMAGDNQHGRDNGGERRIRCNRSTDVHPAEGDHFQGTTDDDTGFHIPENGAD
ncbi:hypothetical protein D3C76_1483690 [compost metagenome]